MLGAIMSTAFGDYLKREIEERGWTRRDAEQYFKISHTAITNLINKERKPDLETLNKIAQGLEVSLAKLIDICGFDIGDFNTSKLTKEEEELISRLRPDQREAMLSLVKSMIDH